MVLFILKVKFLEGEDRHLMCPVSLHFSVKNGFLEIDENSKTAEKVTIHAILYKEGRFWIFDEKGDFCNIPLCEKDAAFLLKYTIFKNELSEIQKSTIKKLPPCNE